MKRLLVVLALLVVGGVGLGFYLGWFHISRAGTGEKTGISITVDQDKINEGKAKVQEKVQELGGKVKEKMGTPGEQAKEGGSKP
jgi:hypothetical protein